MNEQLLRFADPRTVKFLVFDFETCGLNLGSADNKCWQASFLLADAKEIKEEFDLFPFWPDIKVGADAARVTRFNFNDYKRKSCDPLEALDEFESYLYDPNVISIGQNSLGFDSMIHNIWRLNLGKGSDFSYLPRHVDTSCIAKGWKMDNKFSGERILEGDSIGSYDFLSWQFRLKNHMDRKIKVNLKVLCNDLGIDYDPNKHHDGLYDIGLTYEVFKKVIWNIEV